METHCGFSTYITAALDHSHAPELFHLKAIAEEKKKCKPTCLEWKMFEVQQMQLVDAVFIFCHQCQKQKASVSYFVIYCCRVTAPTTLVQHFITANVYMKAVQMTERQQRCCGTCMQAVETKSSSEEEQKQLFSPGLPQSQGDFQYSTLRDLSSHDQDRGEGKVGREEAAVLKGPLPI